MWKQSPDTSSEIAGRNVPLHQPGTAPASESEDDLPTRVRVRIIRPDGSSRDVVVAGHFREEHLCSLVDDELCQLEEDETLVLHLFHPDVRLSQSLKNRWQEGLSDNRQVFVREVLGPTNDPRQVASQLQQVRERMASGERVHLAIRSPRVAAAARDELRQLLLISQRFDEALLNVWVHGDDDRQREILVQLEQAGMVRARDFQQFVAKHPEQKWRAPWLDMEPIRRPKKSKRHHRKHMTSEEAVSDWIRRVEEDREHMHH